MCEINRRRPDAGSLREIPETMHTGRAEKFPYYVKKNGAVCAAFKSAEDAAQWAGMTGGDICRAPRNPRNAGRWPEYSDRENDEMLKMLSEGATVRKVAERFRCSVGHVQKLKSEQRDRDVFRN